MVREIITLQFGELSNYVATHFWNTQASTQKATTISEIPMAGAGHARARFSSTSQST